MMLWFCDSQLLYLKYGNLMNLHCTSSLQVPHWPFCTFWQQGMTQTSTTIPIKVIPREILLH